MSTKTMETITFLISLVIKPDADRQKIHETMKKLAESVRKKPGALFYQSFQRADDNNKLEFIETFADSAAALYHLQNQDESIASVWFSMIELDSITIVGPTSNELRGVLDGYPIANKPVYVDTISGFSPSS